jgi:hypothetical protein
MATISMVAEMAEPVTASRITQHATMPATTAHRFRLCRGSGARTGSLRSFIENHP